MAWKGQTEHQKTPSETQGTHIGMNFASRFWWRFKRVLWHDIGGLGRPYNLHFRDQEQISLEPVLGTIFGSMWAGTTWIPCGMSYKNRVLTACEKDSNFGSKNELGRHIISRPWSAMNRSLKSQVKIETNGLVLEPGFGNVNGCNSIKKECQETAQIGGSHWDDDGGPLSDIDAPLSWGQDHEADDHLQLDRLAIISYFVYTCYGLVGRSS